MELMAVVMTDAVGMVDCIDVHSMGEIPIGDILHILTTSVVTQSALVGLLLNVLVRHYLWQCGQWHLHPSRPVAPAKAPVGFDWGLLIRHTLHQKGTPGLKARC